MKIFAKSALDKQQIESRRIWGVDGIDIRLREGDLHKPGYEKLLLSCYDAFPEVNVETGDRLYGNVPTDLMSSEGRAYVKRVCALHRQNSNAGLVNVHLAGKCQVLAPPYTGFVNVKKENYLSDCIEFLNELDPGNEFLAAENTFPADWMDEEKGIVSFYPFGKISSDFGARLRTFDIGHSGITMHTLARLAFKGGDVGYYPSGFGNIPVYFSGEEQKIAESARTSITQAVCDEFRKANVANVHVNSNHGLSDGFSDGDVSIMDVLELAKHKDITLVCELRDEDYVAAPNQRGMIELLKNWRDSINNLPESKKPAEKKKDL